MLPQQNPPVNNKRFFLGCLGVLLVASGIVFLTGRVIRNLRGPGKTVNDHIVAINRGQYSQAYGFFSPDFQKQTSYKDFQMDLHPFFSLLPFRSSSLHHTITSKEHAKVEGLITGRDGSIFPVYYELDKKKGKWQIVTYRWIYPGERISL